MLSAVCMLSSCLSDDNDDSDYTYYKDTGITTVSLGTMNRYLHTTSSSGADSVYKVTYAGSNYKMSVDQIGHRIFNTDSLPYGTDLQHVIATVTAVNNGVLLLKSATSDSLTYYSNTDSIDFRTPRTIRVVAQDGLRYADYTITLNARKVPVGSLTWEKKAENNELATLDDIRAYAAGGKVFAFGQANGAIIGYSTDVNDGATWTPLSASFSAKASIVAKGNSLYALDNGSVLTSTDGNNWTTVTTNSSLKTLVAASTAHLYALTSTDGNNATGIASSADNGQTWTDEARDNNSAILPDQQVGYSCAPLATNDSIDQVMIVGRSSAANDIFPRTWTKLDDYSSNPISTVWNYVDNSGRTDNALGEIPSLTVTTFGGRPVALVCTGDSISPLLRSVDSGLTWEDSGNELPSGLSATAGKLTMTTDSEGSLWIIANGVVYKH